jgi:hypothetical protein
MLAVAVAVAVALKGSHVTVDKLRFSAALAGAEGVPVIWGSGLGFLLFFFLRLAYGLALV